MEVQTLTVPLDVVESSNGLAMDIGSSAFKLIYLHKNDWEEIQKAEKRPETATLRLYILSITEFDKATAFIRENCAVIRKGDVKPIMCVSGVTANQKLEKLREQVDFDFELVNETDCFLQSFIYLSRTIPAKEMIFPQSPAAAKAREITQKSMDSFKEMSAKGKTDTIIHESEDSGAGRAVVDPDIPIASQGDSIYPAIFIMGGSAGGVFRIDEQGRYWLCDFLADCGRTFLGVCSLFTGGKNFDEIMDLVKDAKESVDFYANDFAISNNSDDIYGESLNDAESQLVYCFGKAVGKTIGDFPVGDLCRSFLKVICLNVLMTAHSHAVKYGARHIFVAGTILNHPVVRSMAEVLYEERIPAAVMSLGQRADVTCHFLRHGSHYGAFGAALNRSLKFLKTPSLTPASGESEKVEDSEPDEQNTHL